MAVVVVAVKVLSAAVVVAVMWLLATQGLSWLTLCLAGHVWITLLKLMGHGYQEKYELNIYRGLSWIT